MAVNIVNKRLFNTGKKVVKKHASTAPKPKTAHRPKKRKNSAELYTLGILNPKRSKKKMANKPKRKTAKASNPFRPRAKAVRAKKRNPNRSSSMSGPLDIVKSGAVALGGLVVTRQLPQIVLAENNTGIMGYGANLLTALLGAFLLSKFAGKSTGTMFGIGGGVYTVSRVLTEQLSPVGKYFALAGMGDAAAAGGMGIVNDYDYNVPLLHDRGGNTIVPPYINRAIAAAMPRPAPPAAAGMSGSRFASRYVR